MKNDWSGILSLKHLTLFYAPPFYTWYKWVSRREKKSLFSRCYLRGWVGATSGYSSSARPQQKMALIINRFLLCLLKFRGRKVLHVNFRRHKALGWVMQLEILLGFFFLVLRGFPVMTRPPSFFAIKPHFSCAFWITFYLRYDLLKSYFVVSFCFLLFRFDMAKCGFHVHYGLHYLPHHHPHQPTGDSWSGALCSGPLHQLGELLFAPPPF